MSQSSNNDRSIMVRVAVGIRRLPDGQCQWADAPVCVLAPSQYYPEDYPPGGAGHCDEWAVYVVWDATSYPRLWSVLSRLGKPSEMPFGAVWDLVSIPPYSRIEDAVRAYLSNRSE